MKNYADSKQTKLNHIANTAHFSFIFFNMLLNKSKNPYTIHMQEKTEESLYIYIYIYIIYI